MSPEYFQFPQLLSPPVRRAAYSDRTAWLMAEMSRLAYLLFEKEADGLSAALLKADFELVSRFDCDGTQAFLAKRNADKMAVLAFRGTQTTDIRDVAADLDAKFYHDQKGARIHNGFYRAFACVEKAVRESVGQLEDFSLYVTGHSLGGALALMAARALNSDHLAACYTFGSPKVGNEEFDDEIKTPIYRIVNANDLVPALPPTWLFYVLAALSWKWARDLAAKFTGYDHHGDVRYLSPCKEDFAGLKVIANYNDFLRLINLWTNKKQCVADHSIDLYCGKLGQWALRRL